MSTSILETFRYYKYLLYQLTQREIKARYKQSFVGYAWVVFNPLAQLLVYTFIFSIILRSPSQNIPYPIFLFAGLLPWGLFQGSVAIATQSLVDNAPLIRKVSFPREIIPYSVMLAKIIDFLVSALIFIAFMLIYRIPFTPQALFVIPLFFIQLFLTAGISLMLSAFNLFYRDVQYLANLVLMLWMYLSPIVYPLELVPEKYRTLYDLNPMVGIIDGYRSALFNFPLQWQLIGWSMLSSVVIFIIGYSIFKRAERVFADIA